MFQLAAPLGLLALSALLAPILIHLVRRPRPVVRVGSLRPLQAATRPLYSWRWHEVLLLALRCVLLIALALLLAGPRWHPQAPARWQLLLPGTTLSGPALAEWSRLRADGFEPRHLAPDFPPTIEAAVRRDSGRDVWSLLSEADTHLPAGSRAVVFGPTWASQFVGPRPVLHHLAVHWHEVAGSPPAPAASPSIRVGLIAGPDRKEDARYLRAALTAVGAVFVTDDTAAWIFQLGAVDLPPAWRDRVQRGAHLVTDAPAGVEPTLVARHLALGESLIPLRQRVALTEGVPLARDSMGEPWLAESRVGAGRHWRFALRFHPDWTDWPLGSAFPAWWRDQCEPNRETAAPIGPAQAAPGLSTAAVPASRTVESGWRKVDLRPWCWALAVAAFVAERLLVRAIRLRRTTR